MTESDDAEYLEDSTSSEDSEFSADVPIPSGSNVGDHSEYLSDAESGTGFSDWDTDSNPLPPPVPGFRPDIEDAEQFTQNGILSAVVHSAEADYQSWPEIPGYIVREFLGKGGFGRVFRAMSTRLNAHIALKVIHERDAGGMDIAGRFAMEVSNAARSGDLHVVRVLDSGSILDDDGQRIFYLASEYLPGGDFRRWLQCHPRTGKSCPNLRQAVECLAKICSSAESLHEAGLVHRDLKPANIFLDARGNPKLGDFGLSGMVSSPGVENLDASESAQIYVGDLLQSRLTVAGDVLGTPSYMAPEMLVGGQYASPASDQYALGVILYQILSGLRPWQDELRDPQERERIEVRQQFLSEGKSLAEVDPPSSKATATFRVRGLELICLRCLRQDASQRYSSLTELRTDLEGWLAGRMITDNWLLQQWGRFVYEPVRQNPLRVLVNVSFSLLLILLIVAYSNSLDPQRATLRDDLQVLRQENARLSNDLTAVRESDRQSRDFLFRSLMALQQLSETRDSTGEVLGTVPVQRQQLLREMTRTSVALIRSAQFPEHERALLQQGHSKLAEFLYRTGELQSAQQVAEALWNVYLRVLPEQTTPDSDETGEILAVAGILVLIAIDRSDPQELERVEGFLETLKQRFAPDELMGTGSQRLQAEIGLLRGRLAYASWVEGRGAEFLQQAETVVEESLQHLRSVAKNDPNAWSELQIGAALATLSRNQYKAGRRDEAIETARTAEQALLQIDVQRHLDVVEQEQQQLAREIEARLGGVEAAGESAADRLRLRLAEADEAAGVEADSILRANAVRIPPSLAGMAVYSIGRRKELVASYSDLREVWTRIDPALLERKVHEQLIGLRFTTVMALRAAGQFEEATVMGNAGLHLCEQLMHRFPDVIGYQREYARGNGNLADMFLVEYEVTGERQSVVSARDNQRAAGEYYERIFFSDAERREQRDDAVKHFLRVIIEEVVLGDTTAAADAFLHAAELAGSGRSTTMMAAEASGLNALGIVLGWGILQQDQRWRERLDRFPGVQQDLLQHQDLRAICGDESQIATLAREILASEERKRLQTTVTEVVPLDNYLQQWPVSQQPQ